ncbi:metallophosphoesterase [Burkholderia ubonensis]|uniref:metallophosphoesterase n=1 Tax=Burkholderia ubonensis TaxID=101571 RepID=UPI0009B303BF|nr:metallophosphoesterase [Burkholderia ubonensis]
MRKSYSAVRRYSHNIAGRDFVVGDVHGCFSQLDATLRALSYDVSRDRLFSIGDLVDRGPESNSVLDAVRRHRIKAIRGNHEDMILRWYYGYGSSEQLDINGGGWFIDLVNRGGLARPIANFIRTLPYAIEIETAYGVVGLLHADAPCSPWNLLMATLERERDEGMTKRKVLWQRSRWRSSKQSEVADWSTTLGSLLGLPAPAPSSAAANPYQSIEGVDAVIVGHTPVLEPTVRGNVINIDTGAVYGGNLTVIDLSDVPRLIDKSVTDVS